MVAWKIASYMKVELKMNGSIAEPENVSRRACILAGTC